MFLAARCLSVIACTASGRSPCPAAFRAARAGSSRRSPTGTSCPVTPAAVRAASFPASRRSGTAIGRTVRLPRPAGLAASALTTRPHTLQLIILITHKLPHLSLSCHRPHPASCTASNLPLRRILRILPPDSSNPAFLLTVHTLHRASTELAISSHSNPAIFPDRQVFTLYFPVPKCLP